MLGAALRSLFTMGRGMVRGLSESAAGMDPIRLFRHWFDEAGKSSVFLPESIAVATSSRDGRPSVRMMLLKGIDERGFVFYTNNESRKVREMTENPHAAFAIHWAILQRQIRVEGSLEKLSEQDSAAYFRTRTRGSQIGAWASRQSSVLADREELVRRVREVEERFRGNEIPLPPFWGGYRLVPERIEFWQGRANRLHDRLEYTWEDGEWSRLRLSP
jgi:pyridoxamine 5'-phosphate oxidase